jgi:hypothetical protein
VTVTPYLFREETPQALELAVNAVLAPLLNERILGMELDAVRNTPYFSKNSYVALSTDTLNAGALLNPYIFKTFVASADYDATKLAFNFMAANPTFFFSPIYAIYRPLVDDPLQSTIVAIIYNTDQAEGFLNWGYSTVGGGGAAPIGPAGGDLGGAYPTPAVRGLFGIPMSAAATVGGQELVYNAASGNWEPVQPIRYFASGAAAQAASPFINNTTVVIYPGSPTSEAGTWQVTTNGGIAFPADYTKVSDATDTASEVSIIDSGNYFTSSNLEGATQEIGAGTILAATGALPIGTTPLATHLIAIYGSAEWVVELVNGTLRYHVHLSVSHDGVNAVVEEFGGVPGPGVGVIPVTFDADVAGLDFRLLAVATGVGWSYRVRCMDALVV